MQEQVSLQTISLCALMTDDFNCESSIFLVSMELSTACSLR